MFSIISNFCQFICIFKFISKNFNASVTTSSTQKYIDFFILVTAAATIGTLSHFCVTILFGIAVKRSQLTRDELRFRREYSTGHNCIMRLYSFPIFVSIASTFKL